METGSQGAGLCSVSVARHSHISAGSLDRLQSLSGWMDRWVGGWLNGQTDRPMGGWMDGQTDVWAERLTDGWMDG